MNRELTPRDLASLDPYARFGSDVKAIGNLLEESEEVVAVETQEVMPDLVKREQNRWKELLGATFTVNPLPKFIIPEVIKALSDKKLELIFMPPMPMLVFGEKSKEVMQDYFDDIKSLYPKWKRYEDYTRQQLNVISNAKNFKAWYWENERKGKIIDSQGLGNEWLAVETLMASDLYKNPRPEHGGSNYERFPLNEYLGVRTRLGTTYEEADKIISDANKGDLVEMFGVGEGSRFILPNALGANLIFNRFEIIQNPREWTTDSCSTFLGARKQVVMGNWEKGGAADVSSESAGNKNSGYLSLGYRVFIKFPREQSVNKS